MTIRDKTVSGAEARGEAPSQGVPIAAMGGMTVPQQRVKDVAAAALKAIAEAEKRALPFPSSMASMPPSFWNRMFRGGSLGPDSPEEAKVLAQAIEEEGHLISGPDSIIEALKQRAQGVEAFIFETPSAVFDQDIRCFGVFADSQYYEIPLLQAMIISGSHIPQDTMCGYLHCMFQKMAYDLMKNKAIGEEVAMEVIVALELDEEKNPKDPQAIKEVMVAQGIEEVLAESLVNELMEATDRWVNTRAQHQYPSTQRPLRIGTHLGETALHVAARFACHQIVSYLLKMGAHVDAKDAEGYTPLMNAISNAHNAYKTARVLLENHANPNQQCGSRMPLNVAATLSEPQMLQLLVEKGAMVNCVNSCCLETPILNALFVRNVDMFQEIVALQGCNLDVKDKYGTTVVHALVEMTPSQTNRAFSILDKHCPKEKMKEFLQTPDYAGAYPIHRFLKHLVRLQWEAYQSKQPLAFTVAEVNQVLQLLTQGSPTDINLQDQEHNTPLHLAVIYGMNQLIGDLLQNPSCDPSIRNGAGFTPLQLAVKSQREALIPVFRPLLRDDAVVQELCNMKCGISKSMKKTIEDQHQKTLKPVPLPFPAASPKKGHKHFPAQKSSYSIPASSEKTAFAADPGMSDDEMAHFVQANRPHNEGLDVRQTVEKQKPPLPLHRRVLLWQSHPDQALSEQGYRESPDPRRAALLAQLGEPAVIEAHAFPSRIDDFVFYEGFITTSGTSGKKAAKKTTITCTGVRIEGATKTPVQFTYVRGADGTIYHRLMTPLSESTLCDQMLEMERHQTQTLDTQEDPAACADPIGEEEDWTTVLGPHNGWVAQAEVAGNILISKIGDPVSYLLNKPKGPSQ